MAQLNGRNTSFICCAQIDCPEPEGQGQTSAVHDRSGSYGGLVPTGTALEGVTTVDGIVFHAAALGAYKPIGEPQTEQFRSASILAVVTAAKFLECDLSCACHNDVPPLRPGNIIAHHLSNKTDFFKILWLAELSR